MTFAIICIKIFVTLMVLIAGIVCAYHFGLLLVVLATRKKYASLSGPSTHRFAVVIPAHNEEANLAHSLNCCEKFHYPREQYAVYVIADNCTDRTAEIAISHGCQCLQRRNLEKRGKGFALDWALPQVLAEGWDAVVILDADCRLDAHALKVFDARLTAGDRVLQSNDAVDNPDESPTSYLLAVANVLENEMFYAPKSRLGWSVFLRGTGMVFHKNILQSFPWRAESLVEDTEYTFVLLENGIPIRFLPEVRVASAFPTSRNDLQVQRTRWTGGSLTVGLHKGLRLMRKGISQARWLWIDAGFTSLILNRSFIVVQLALTALISFILYFFSSDRWTFCVSMGCFTMIAAYFIYALTGVILLGLTKHRIMLMLQTPWVALRYLVMTLIILSGKIPLTWQRTSRSSSNHLT